MIVPRPTRNDSDWEDWADQVQAVTTGPVFSATASVDTPIPSAVWTPIALNDEKIDTHGGHDNVTANTRYTVPAGWGGTYWVSAGAYFSGGLGGSIRAAAISLDGTVVGHTQVNLPNVDIQSIPTIPAPLVLLPGQYVELRAYQNAGTNRTAGGTLCALSLFYLRPL